MRVALLAFITVVGLATAAHSKVAILITECNTVVPIRQRAVLQNDLVCDSSATWGVVLERGARLELNGHSIVGGQNAGVYCPARCRVFGPGEIVGSAGSGINALRVKVVDVTVRDAGRWGITAFKAVRLENVTVVNSGKAGIAANRVRGWDVTVVNAGGTAALVALVGERSGIAARRAIRIDGLLVTGSARGGIAARRCLITDGEISGNQADPTLPVVNPPEFPGGDLRCTGRVKLTDTACGTSLDPETGETWGLCASD